MANIDWSAIESEFSNSYKIIPDGEYTATIKSIKVSDNPTQSGAYSINIELEPSDEGRFPFFATHWLSFKNDNWRMHHMRAMMTDMGVLDEKAKKVVEECEGAGTNEQIAEAYRKKFAALGEKHPKAKVVVDTQAYKHKDKQTGKEELREDGHRTEFNGVSFMPAQELEGLMKRYPNVPTSAQRAVSDALHGEIDMSLDTPF